MARNYTPILDDWLEEMGELSDAEYGRLIRWCQEYNITGKAEKPCGNERFYATRCINYINKVNESYEEARNKRKKAGETGAATRWQAVAKDSYAIANDSNAIQTIAPDSKNGYSESESKSKSKSNTPNGVNNTRERDFERFWACYPKKVGKQAAERAFAKARKKCNVDRMIAAIEKQKQSRQWQKDNGDFIPNPTTWLNQGRWEDVLEESHTEEQAVDDCGFAMGNEELEAIARLKRLRDSKAQAI